MKFCIHESILISTVAFFTVLLAQAEGQSENWIYKYNGIGNGEDYAYSAVYGSDGNIYIAGAIEDINSGYDFTVVSLTSAGTERWVYKYNGTGNKEDEAYSLVYGADDNIYIAGATANSGSGKDLTVISLANTGDHENWVYTYNGTGNSTDEAYSIVYGADGNIYVSGTSYNSGSYSDFTIISLTSAGTERWVYKYNGTGNSTDEAYSIVYGTDGNIYATGYSYSNDTYEDLTIISLTSAGTERWVYKYNGGTYSHDIGTSIVYSSDGYIYASGGNKRDGAMSSNDKFTIIKITNTGQVIGWYKYNDSWGAANSIVYGSDGKVYAAGWTHESGGSGGFGDFTVISPAEYYGIEETKIIPELKPEILQAFPNPFTIAITIRYQIPSTQVVSLNVYNLSGRLIRTLVNSSQKPGMYSIKWHGKDNYGHLVPNGIYFYRLKTKDFEATKKTILLR